MTENSADDYSTAAPSTISDETWKRYTAAAQRYVPRGVTVRRVLRDAHVRHAAAKGWN